jgi:hypothetical protein
MEEKPKNKERVERGKRIMEKVLGEWEEQVEFKIQARVSVLDLANVVMGLDNRRDMLALKNITNLTQMIFKIGVETLVKKEEEITDVDQALQYLEDMGIINIDSTSLSGGAIKRNRNRMANREMQSEILKERARRSVRIGPKRITQEEIDNFDPVKYGEELSRIIPDTSLIVHATSQVPSVNRQLEIERKKQQLLEELQNSQENPQGLHPSPRTDLKEGEADVTFGDIGE